MTVVGMEELKRFTISRHAAQRALDMQLSAEEIQLALLAPEVIRRSLKYGGLTRVRGRIAIPVKEDGTIPTILWRRDEGDPRYDREDLDPPDYLQEQK